ncbi:unnamed protein product [Allacma fusca]|uniref:Uncharacterized protein n=1 Tax=Allacma fusca TaxID=39272 RepID=A0A8J2LMW2_9HEXA|nr:unnamed protein product [Allacma fusca]
MNHLTKFPAVEDKLKLATPVIGLITVILSGVSLRPGSDLFLLITAIVGFLSSSGLIVAKYFDWIDETKTKLWRWADVIFHGVLCVLLTFGWVICMVNIFTLWSLVTGGMLTARFFSLISASMDIGFYGVIAWTKYMKIKGGPAPHDTIT